MLAELPQCLHKFFGAFEEYVRPLSIIDGMPPRGARHYDDTRTHRLEHGTGKWVRRVGRNESRYNICLKPALFLDNVSESFFMDTALDTRPIVRGCRIGPASQF